MNPESKSTCPVPRRVLQYRHILGTAELAALQRGAMITSPEARYQAWLQDECIHVIDELLDACLYEFPIARLPDRRARIDKVHVLDDPDIYLRCSDDRDETERVTMVLGAIFTPKT